MKIRVFAAVRNHRGKVRAENQDDFYLNGQFLSPAQMQEGALLTCDADAHMQLYGVMDGVGGDARGDLASSAAAASLAEMIRDVERVKPEALLETLFARANDAVSGLRESQGVTSGTTMALALIHEQTLYVAHVGDSRVYLLRSGKLIALTQDHSRVQELYDAGIINTLEAEQHPQRHTITRFLDGEAQSGSARPTVAKPLSLRKGDLLLLCSDGVTDFVEEDQLLEILHPKKLPRDKAEAVVEAALMAGGKDNATALVVEVAVLSRFSWVKVIGWVLFALLLCVGILLAMNWAR